MTAMARVKPLFHSGLWYSYAMRNATLGGELRRLLAETGMTQREAADRAGTTKENINRWVNEVSIPDPPYYKKLAKLLGMTDEAFALLLVASLTRRWEHRQKRP